MSTLRSDAVRTRYPLRAILAVAGAWLVFLIQVLSGVFIFALVIPLIPFFICLVLSSAGLLASAHQYALSQAQRVPRAAKLARTRDAQTLSQDSVAPATSG